MQFILWKSYAPSSSMSNKGQIGVEFHSHWKCLGCIPYNDRHASIYSMTTRWQGYLWIWKYGFMPIASGPIPFSHPSASAPSPSSPPPPIPFLPPHPHCLLTTFLLTSFSFLCSSVLYLSQKEEWGRKVVQEEGREGVMVHCSGREGEDQFDWSP